MLLAACSSSDNPENDTSAPQTEIIISENKSTVPSEETGFPDTGADVPGGKYSVAIVQTEYLPPLTSDDPYFSIYKSGILGEFDAVASSGETEISRLSLNSLFGGEKIGWAEPFTILLDDYNNDGEYEFAIGQPLTDSPEFKYVMIGIDADGVLYQIGAHGYKEDGYIYNAEQTPSFLKLTGTDAGISVTVNNGSWLHAQYLWDGADNAFVFKGD